MKEVFIIKKYGHTPTFYSLVFKGDFWCNSIKNAEMFFTYEEAKATIANCSAPGMFQIEKIFIVGESKPTANSQQPTA